MRTWRTKKIEEGGGDEWYIATKPCVIHDIVQLLSYPLYPYLNAIAS